MERGKFDARSLKKTEPMATKIGVDDYVGTLTPGQNFITILLGVVNYPNSSQGLKAKS